MKAPNRTTPVAPAPYAPGEGEAKRAKELTAPIAVSWTSGDRELERGELVIGRSPSSDVVLEDSLVSRNHARISVRDDGAVVVEDLHSANGVFVNGVPIAQNSALLREGDRLLIGRTEISLFSVRTSGTMPVGERIAGEPTSTSFPASGSMRIARVGTRSVTPSMELPHTALTERTTVLAMISRLASALIASGKPGEANELIGTHLKKLLLGASAGLPMPEDVLHEAAHHALELYQRTRAVSWVSYMLEIHLVTRRAPSLRNLGALRVVLEQVGQELHPSGLTYLLESLGARFDDMTDDERARFAELGRVAARRPR